MPAITSADGTTIAYERAGTGPALVLVDGAMCYRAAGPMRPLATLLQDTFTVYTYDRRGRGESSDTLPYAVAREIEDLQALIAQAGGEAYVYGISSGAALALPTAALVRAAGASAQSLQQAPKAAADALPTAAYRTLDGQTHDVAPDALAPVLVEFFAA